MYIPKAYPCWLYHASEPARIVDTHEERELLGDEWATHPDLVSAPALEVALTEGYVENAALDLQIMAEFAAADAPTPRRKRK